MKSMLTLQAAGHISPLYLNSGLACAPLAWLSVRTPRTAPVVEAVNGDMLAAGRSTFGIVSEPQPAPEPCMEPSGVDAVALTETVNEKTRRAANLRAISESQSLKPDPAVMRGYSGGGGIGESINEYYTPHTVVQAMYAAAGLLLSSEPLRILDLACGTGNLLAQAPEGSLVVGVEYDATSARIAGKLLPHAAIHRAAAEQYVTQSTDPLFDLCILNPPYGPRSAGHLDPSSNKIHSNEHYMLQKAIERVKHSTGLVVALVNMNLTGGSSHDIWRHRVSMYGRVVNSVIVPRQAFASAGAGVTTVILTIRRHDVGVREALGTLTRTDLVKVLDEYCAADKGFHTGKMVYDYSASKKEFVLANAHSESQRLGQGRDLSEGRFNQPEYSSPLVVTDGRLRVIRNHVFSELQKPGLSLRGVLGQISALISPNAMREATRAAGTASMLPLRLGTLSPDRRWTVTSGGWQPNDDFADPPVADALVIAAALARLQDASPTQLLHTTRRLRTMNRNYLDRHGRYDKRRLSRLSARVPMLGMLVAHLDAKHELNIRVPETRELNVTGTPSEVAAQLADLMLLTEETLMEHAGIGRASAETLLQAGYCWTGSVWTAPGVYYVGNAVNKAERCRLDARQEEGVRQAALLRQAGEFLSRIEAASLEDLKLTPRDTTIPMATLEAWVNTYLSTTKDGKHLINVERVRGNVKFMVAASQEERQNLNARQNLNDGVTRDLNQYLNFKTPMQRIDGAKDMSKEEYRAERAAAMDEAREYEDRLSIHFQSWLPTSQYAEATVQAYNMARRSYLIPDGITDPINLVDWKGPSLHPFQCMDVRTMAASDGMILGYDVGLGKTYSGLMLIAYLRMLGQANRPVIVVPAGLIGNWSTNAHSALPTWKVLSIGMSPATYKDGSPRYKKRASGNLMYDGKGQPVQAWTEDNAATKRVKLAQVAAGQCDMVIMSREAFTSLPMTESNMERMIENDVQFQARIEANDAFDSKGRKNRHDILVRQAVFTAACHKRLKQASENDLLFERFGFDLLMFDECHGFKNLYSAPSAFGEVPKFLGAGTESNRALDAVFKGRLIREQGGKTYGLTASWVKNSPLEFHSMINLVSDDLPAFGLGTNESLMEQYLNIEPRIITTLEGDVTVRSAVVGFQRLKELKSIRDTKIIVRAAGDKEVVTRDGKPLHVPQIREEEITFDMTPEQMDVYREFRKQAQNADSHAEGEDHVFSVMWRMRKLTADPALLGYDFVNPRFTAFAEQAMRVRALGHKTLGFMSIGEKEGSFSRLEEVLVAAGYPAHEIEIVSSHSHSGAVAKLDLEDRFNYGDLTLVIGSEVLAEGFNLQIGTGAIIHADIPWNHDGIKQRNGRGGRQGNVLDHVLCLYLLARGSFDTITYTIMRGKKGWKDQIDGHADDAENTGAEFGADEIAILMSEDPDAMRVQIQEKKLELTEASAHAALRRKLQAVYRTLNARKYLEQIVEIASQHKHGWTAHDFLKYSHAKRSLQRLVLDVEDPSVFPLARLLTFTGQMEWSYGVPFHEGLSFDYQGSRVTVSAFDLNSAHVEYADAATPGQIHRKALAVREVSRQGRNFRPTEDAAQYRQEVVEKVEVKLNVLLSPDARVYVMNGQTTKPAPASGQALTVLVIGNHVQSITGSSPERLRVEFMRGNTVIHYLTSEAKAGLVIDHAVVLCPNLSTTQQASGLRDTPEFHERLRTIASLALAS